MTSGGSVWVARDSAFPRQLEAVTGPWAFPRRNRMGVEWARGRDLRMEHLKGE